MSNIENVKNEVDEQAELGASALPALQDRAVAGPQRTRSAWRLILTLLLAGGSGAAAGLLGGRALKPVMTGIASANLLWILLVVLCLTLFIAVLVHECGHLLGGTLVGSRFLLLIVGPLKIQRSQAGIQIRLNTSLALAGGLAASAPVDENNLVRKMLIMTAGGPIASLLLAVVAAIGAFAAGAPNHTGLVGMVLLIMGIVSAMIAIVTSIPGHAGGFFSDGARILMLAKGGPAVERWCALILLQLATIAGQRPREWNSSLLAKVHLQTDNSLDYAVGCSFGYYHALDSGKIQEARGYLEEMLAVRMSVPGAVRASFLLEAAYFEARYHHNAARARAWLAQTQGRTSLIDRCTRLRVEGALLLAEGKIKDALQRIQEGLEQVKYAIHKGTGRMEEAWLHALLEESQQVGDRDI